MEFLAGEAGEGEKSGKLTEINQMETQMAEHNHRRFYADDKFGALITELERRGWSRVQSSNECEIIWTNLRNIDFQQFLGARKVVNHFKGSQHLSNKVRRLFAMLLK